MIKAKMTNKKKGIAYAGGMAVVLAIGSVAAYFTSSDEATNKFEIGKIDIDLFEPNWKEPENVTPNEEVVKDPKVANDGENDAYVFVAVLVPKKEIITSDVATGARNAKAPTQLFQLNKDKDSDGAKAWSGTDTYNTDDWYLVLSDTSIPNQSIYVFAYGSETELTPLAKGAKTSEVFQSVTFANAIEGQSDEVDNEALENSIQSIYVQALGIQTTNLTKDDIKDPFTVLNLLLSQSGNGAEGIFDHSGSPEHHKHGNGTDDDEIGEGDGGDES